MGVCLTTLGLLKVSLPPSPHTPQGKEAWFQEWTHSQRLERNHRTKYLETKTRTCNAKGLLCNINHSTVYLSSIRISHMNEFWRKELFVSTECLDVSISFLQCPPNLAYHHHHHLQAYVVSRYKETETRSLKKGARHSLIFTKLRPCWKMQEISNPDNFGA